MSTRFSAQWTTLDDLIPEHESWSALAATAIEPNPFYEPHFLTASQRHLHPQTPIQCLIIRDQTQSGQISGVFPLHRPLWRHGLLGQSWSLYSNAYSSLGTPLLSPEAPKEILLAALHALRESPGPNRLLWPLLIEDGPVAQLRDEIARENSLALHSITHENRAILDTNLSVEGYQKTLWTNEKRKHYARKHKALAHLGEIALRRIRGTQPEAHGMLDAFLALEAKSWKGDQGTALAAQPQTRAFAADAFLAPETLFEALCLNGTPIAMGVTLVGQGVGYSVKTAYDPEFARFSPGFLLDAAALELVCGDGPLRKLDSCAGPGHPLEGVWREHQRMSQCLMGLKPTTPPASETSPFSEGWYSGWIRLFEKARRARHASTYTTKPQKTGN